MLADAATADQQAAADQVAIGSSAPLLGSVLPQESASVPSVASRAAPAAPEPQGPPPHLSLGSDDIYWVHQLQSGLMNEGYYCGEEEMEDFIFESGTESAVLAFQASHLIMLCVMLHEAEQSPALTTWHMHCHDSSKLILAQNRQFICTPSKHDLMIKHGLL